LVHILIQVKFLQNILIRLELCTLFYPVIIYSSILNTVLMTLGIK